MSRPLGSRQAKFLALLNENGAWFPGCCWQWGSTDTEIEKVMQSLVGRGLVEKEKLHRNFWRITRYRYVATEAGKLAAS
jgi:predicted transcriptional regulator